ncbi:formylglycine-generating enzyme family protein [Sorangium sp. So ce861]|uniref:formylglycine-generating enzyme family protein n=1 Tax=Sorangium sp. So ce861 TaxID=3133323 RepID=UPI003F607265
MELETRSPPTAGSARVTNLEIVGRKGDEITIRFDVAWDNSFREPSGQGAGNWDAVWLFVKYRGTEEVVRLHDDGDIRAAADRGDLSPLAEAAAAAVPAPAAAAVVPVPAAAAVPVPAEDAAAAPVAAAAVPIAAAAAPIAAAAVPIAAAAAPIAAAAAPIAAAAVPIAAAAVPIAAAAVPIAAAAVPVPAAAVPVPAAGRSTSLRLRGKHEVHPVTPGQKWRVQVERHHHRSPMGPLELSVEHIAVRALGDRGHGLEASRMSQWRHALITAAGVPGGGEVLLPEDQRGVFLYRSAENAGVGPVVFREVTLTLCRPTDGPAFADYVSLWVFGIEMVYIPEGPFSLGDPRGPGGPAACFYDASLQDSTPDRSYRVTSDGQIEVGPNGEKPRLYYDGDTAEGNEGDGQGPIPKEFPKGYGAFYVMKYQITQGQYGDFVNTLQGPARTVRFSYWFGSYRYTTFMTQSSARVTLRPDNACNWLAWMDGAAFACWAGLRPLTELEYEKACRGPAQPVSGEYAWGTTTAVQAQVIFGDERGVSWVNGNAAFQQAIFVGGDGGSGPLPGNAFGGPPASWSGACGFGMQRDFVEDQSGLSPIHVNERERTGASYYRVMGLSGNLWEWCVTVGEPQGRAFTGTPGTGELDGFGNPDVKTLGWPDVDVVGAGARGGSWYTALTKLRLADRSYGSGLQSYSTRAHDMGFRCARTVGSSAPTR